MPIFGRTYFMDGPLVVFELIVPNENAEGKKNVNFRGHLFLKKMCDKVCQVTTKPEILTTPSIAKLEQLRQLCLIYDTYMKLNSGSNESLGTKL